MAERVKFSSNITLFPFHIDLPELVTITAKEDSFRQCNDLVLSSCHFHPFLIDLPKLKSFIAETYVFRDKLELLAINGNFFIIFVI